MYLILYSTGSHCYSHSQIVADYWYDDCVNCLELSSLMKEKSQMIEKLDLALEKQQDGMTNILFDMMSVMLICHKKCSRHNAITITRSPRSFSTSHLLSNLHWLTIHKRINFKVATVTYKVLSTQQPAYLYNLISYHQSSRLLRISSQSLLHVPRIKTDFGSRAFSSAATETWNRIPTAIRASLDSFKLYLKTHYFALS